MAYLGVGAPRGRSSLSFMSALFKLAETQHTGQGTASVRGVGGAVGALLASIAGVACEVSQCAAVVLPNVGALWCRLSQIVLWQRRSIRGEGTYWLEEMLAIAHV